MSPHGQGGQATGATLRIPFNADKEIAQLPRKVQGDVMVFMRKFRDNHDQQGLQLKMLHETKKGPRLYSARVSSDYRAIMARTGGNDFLLLTVTPRQDVYDNLDRYSYAINSVTGGIEYINLQTVEDKLESARRREAPVASPAQVTPPTAEPAAEPLFVKYTDEQLTELGVAEALLPLTRKITTEDELLSLVELAPQITTEVLLELYQGKTPEEVMETVTRPVAADGPVDTEDYQAALARPATQVTTDDEALRIVLQDSFQRWLTYLHPTQARLVERDYTGPARVSGGPGTGKTIVALHRVKYLVDRCLAEQGNQPGKQGADPGTPVLLTTFNKNLAVDLRARLLLLGGRELADRVDVTNVDELASRVAREAESGNQGGKRKRRLNNNDVPDEWQTFLHEIGETRWDPEFLAEEWSQVILGQAIKSRSDYFRARRPGRGRKISRTDRHEIWQLVERFTKRLDEAGKETFQQVAERAARLEMEHDSQVRRARENGDQGGRLRHRYRHVVVDEAQDLHAAHWKMLRAMVAPGPNDMFIVGDTHQRVYQNRTSLGSLGVNIRGRSTKLTLSYRTTREILTSALGLLSGETYDDLDDGADNLTGYRSVLFGSRPRLEGFKEEAEELDAICRQTKAWLDETSPPETSPSSIAICMPTGRLVDKVTERLTEAGIKWVQVGREGPAQGDGVHVGTMQRFKGLEYQRMIIAGVSDGLVPLSSIRRLETSDPMRYQRERQRARSVLFVAATRARDDLVIFWHGTPSPFLPVS